MGKVLVVILAAGGATRFGSTKQSASVAGVSLAARALRTASEAGAEKVRIVVGAHAEATIRALALATGPMPPQVEVIENPHWESGQASSVAAALTGIDETCDAVLIMPVDQPFLEGALLREMIARWQDGARLVAPTVNGEARGAPALFGKEYFAELRALAGDMGGRAVLRRHADRVITVQATENQLTDIDTKEDLDAAKARVEERAE